jgi:hypothetical protein
MKRVPSGTELLIRPYAPASRPAHRDLQEQEHPQVVWVEQNPGDGGTWMGPAPSWVPTASGPAVFNRWVTGYVACLTTSRPRGVT